MNKLVSKIAQRPKATLVVLAMTTFLIVISGCGKEDQRNCPPGSFCYRLSEPPQDFSCFIIHEDAINLIYNAFPSRPCITDNDCILQKGLTKNGCEIDDFAIATTQLKEAEDFLNDDLNQDLANICQDLRGCHINKFTGATCVQNQCEVIPN